VGVPRPRLPTLSYPQIVAEWKKTVNNSWWILLALFQLANDSNLQPLFVEKGFRLLFCFRPTTSTSSLFFKGMNKEISWVVLHLHLSLLNFLFDVNVWKKKGLRKNQSNSSALSYPFVCFANQVDENIKTKDGSGRRRKNVEPVSVNRKSNRVRQEIEKSSIFLFLIATNDPKNKQPIQHFFRDGILFRWSYYIRVCLFLFLFLF
jgi:hypothetical protein